MGSYCKKYIQNISVCKVGNPGPVHLLLKEMIESGLYTMGKKICIDHDYESREKDTEERNRGLGMRDPPTPSSQCKSLGEDLRQALKLLKAIQYNL
jgi:hypothetical protein